MATPSQTRALKNYRKRLDQRGMSRFEVLGLSSDRELIRSVAKRLAEDADGAGELRASLRRHGHSESPKRGGILAALRRSPLVGADLNFDRPVLDSRQIEL